MRTPILAIALAATLAAPLRAQTLAVNDPVIQSLWTEGMEHSQVDALAQVLMDSIGPRLTGSPGHRSGNEWLIRTYRGWGIEATAEQYGTWTNWRRGITHLDLVAPRVRSLEAMMLAWSPGTGGKTVRGPVMLLPDLADSAAYAQWLPSVKGRFVAIGPPEASCRPMANWTEHGTEASVEAHRERRQAAQRAWNERVGRTGYDTRTLPVALEQAGALGVLASNWSGGWGVTRIFNARTTRVPTVDVGCEDYGLLARLAERGQGPVLSLTADAEFMGEGPVHNTIATVRGSEKPDEIIMLSAHFDSWDGASGATDNGTGTVMMLEAMRLLRKVYPNPKRTIIVGHWGGEEQGLNGSRAWAADHPEVVANLHVLFNQDNGTGRIRTVSMQGFVDAGTAFGKWFARLPDELVGNIDLQLPGNPSGGGTDNAAFVCYGAPAFSLGATSWDYGTYTWHTTRDTWDKLVMDDLRSNATLAAMLVYLADQEAEPLGRDRRVMTPNPRTGEQRTWPECQTPARTRGESTR